MAVAAIKIDGSATPQLAKAVGATVTLSNNSNTGVTTWLWEIIDQPAGSAAALATPTTATCDITLDLEGSYLFRLTLNAAGTPVVSTGLATVPQSLTGIRVPAAFERLEAGARGFAPALSTSLTTLEGLASRGPVMVCMSKGILPAGKPVYVTGEAALPNGMVVPEVDVAKADSVATLPAIGICLDTQGGGAGKVRVRTYGNMMERTVNTAGKAFGDPVYVSDLGALAFAAGTNRALIGYVSKVDASGSVFIDAQGAQTALDLKSTSASKGASLVGVQDSAGYLAGTNVETCLAEAMKYVPLAVADPGGANAAIPVTHSASIGITTAGAETNTLADPAFVGQVLLLYCDTYAVGDRVITAASGINQAGNTHMTFGAAKDAISLRAYKVGGALKWLVVSNDGVALS